MLEAVLSGLVLGFALVFSVGPVIFTILKLRINYGFISALYFVLGVWISDLIWIIIANFFGGLLNELINLKKELGIFGSIFLVGLGIFYLFFKKYHSKEDIDKGIKINSTTHIKLFITGFLINTLNPAVIALWLAAAAKSLSNTWNERLVVFSLCLSINIVADIFKIKLAGKLRETLTEKNISIINKISGLLFIGFGIALLLSVI